VMDFANFAEKYPDPEADDALAPLAPLISNPDDYQQTQSSGFGWSDTRTSAMTSSHSTARRSASARTQLML